MSYGPSFHDNQPITWWNRVPIFATGILTAMFTAGVILCAVLGVSAALPPLAFVPQAFVQGAFWQPLTYAFVDRMSFFTPLGLICFYMWAVEIEKYIGRQRFVTLFGMVLLAQPLIALAWWKLELPFNGSSFTAMAIYGNYQIMAAMLIGFATLYPNVEYLFGWAPLKWFAFVCFVAGSLMALGQRDFFSLTLLWAVCGITFGYIRFLQKGASLPLPDFGKLFRPKPKVRVLPDPEASPRQRRTQPTQESMDAVDALLDKIARSGMSSLTARERAQLERARETLMKKESGPR